ncbi:MAG: hypothetical protein J6O50_08065 [Ruminiclostridium sp.]|nr:hypothetical protein [Ruminiclostridium sp.]
MKKIVSMTIALIVLLNVAGFGFMSVKASAFGPIAVGMLEVIDQALFNAASSTALYIIDNNITNTGSASLGFDLNGFNSHLNSHNYTTTENSVSNELVTLTVGEGNIAALSVADTCPEEEREFAQYLSNNYNSIFPAYRVVSDDGTMSAEAYSHLKNVATNSYLKYVDSKQVLDTAEVFANAGANVYNFDFTGPIQDVTIPTKTNLVGNTIDGFELSRPYLLNENGMFASVEEAKAAGAQYSSMGMNGASAAVRVSNCGYGSYVIYNGQIYYFVRRSHGNASETSVELTTSDYPDRFINANGISLKDAGCNTVRGLLTGYYICKDINATTNYPTNATEDSLTTTSGGGLISIHPTQAEQIIGSGINSGIISGNPNLTIGANGEITGADGIDLSSIEALLKSMGALDASQLSALQAINSNTKKIADVLTAEQAITAKKTFDIKTPSNIVDKFPFSLPFDIYNTFNLLSAEPKAPKFTFPLKMDGVFDLSFEVDLSEYEWIAEIVRWLLFVVFVVGLIIVTNKLIGRG